MLVGSRSCTRSLQRPSASRSRGSHPARQDRAEERARQVHGRACSYGELPDGADVVVVATPPSRHAADAIHSLERGAAVIVEKPLATTLDDADRLVEVAAAHGDRLGYAENLAFAPVIERALALGHSLGPLTHLEARAEQPRPDWGDFLTESWGGGALFDLGVHPLAVVLLMAAPAKVVEVTALLEGADDIAVDEYAAVRLRFDSGLSAHVVASWRSPNAVWDLQAASDTGVVRAELLPALLLEHDGEPIALPPVTGGDGSMPQLAQFGYTRQLAAFTDDFAAGRAPEMGARFGRLVLDIVAAAYASAARSGRPEPVPFTGPRDRTPLQLWRA